MSDLIQANYRLLRVLPRFGIHLGFGDKSVVEVCRAQGVSMELFLLVCNISTFDDFLPDTAMFKILCFSCRTRTNTISSNAFPRSGRTFRRWKRVP